MVEMDEYLNVTGCTYGRGIEERNWSSSQWYTSNLERGCGNVVPERSCKGRLFELHMDIVGQESNKGADHSMHLCSFNSAFVVCSLVNMLD